VAPLTDKMVFVIGPFSLQNRLMAHYLEQSTGVKSESLGHFRDITAGEDQKNGRHKLVLWDCLGKDLKACLQNVESSRHWRSSEELMGLFNVAPEMGIEEETVNRGVQGFFYENDPLEQLSKGVCAMFDGELWLSRKIMTECIVKNSHKYAYPRIEETCLTQRERQILLMISVGLTNQEVADKSFISLHTVKAHLYNIFKKINVPNRLQAALWATKNLSP
jgi:DNA-binding CsgD family transcriptional regulator